MKTPQEILDHYIELVEVERQEEREQFRKRFLETPLDQRMAKGLTLYPVSIEEVKVGLGDRLLVEINKPQKEEPSNVFQVGNIVSLWSNTDAKKKPFTTGVITKSRATDLVIALDKDELPDWAHEGKLGLDLYYDERTFNEMQKALKAMKEAAGDRSALLREVLFGEDTPYVRKGEDAYSLPDLNDSQNEALRLIHLALDVAIVHGPPGTGKTHTLIHSIVHSLKREKQVLVTAPSNLAVDLLVEKLAIAGIDVVRVGHPARISEVVLQRSLDVQCAIHPASKNIKELRKEADKTWKQAFKFKRSFGKAEREERKRLKFQARELQKEAKRQEKAVLKSVLDRAQVLASTITGSNAPMLDGRRFSTVFIDEAAQSMLPASLIPILKSDRVIFAGDHCQLPPTIKSMAAGKSGLAESLFERCMHKFPKVSVMLRTQYRMNRMIMGFSSRQFYQDGLIADPSVADHRLSDDPEKPLLEHPVHFVDTAGCGYDEVLNPETLSRSNPGEAGVVLRHLAALLAGLPKPDPEDLGASPRIGIISPYKDQVKLLRREAAEYKPLWPWLKRVSIDSVDGFQGQERDIIYISLVRSNPKGEIGFLGDTRRMNVALTRARKKLVVIGDSATLGNHGFYQAFLDYVDEINSYASAWEFME